MDVLKKLKLFMQRWFMLARHLPSTISACWHIPWTSELSALKDVGHNAAKTLPLPSAGSCGGFFSALRAPSSPGPLVSHSPMAERCARRGECLWQSVHLFQLGWKEGRMGREWHQKVCSLNSDLAARTGYHDPVQPRHRHPPKGYTSPGEEVTCLQINGAPHCRAE